MNTVDSSFIITYEKGCVTDWQPIILLSIHHTRHLVMNRWRGMRFTDDKRVSQRPQQPLLHDEASRFSDGNVCRHHGSSRSKSRCQRDWWKSGFRCHARNNRIKRENPMILRHVSRDVTSHDVMANVFAFPTPDWSTWRTWKTVVALSATLTD